MCKLRLVHESMIYHDHLDPSRTLSCKGISANSRAVWKPIILGENYNGCIRILT